MKETRAAEVVAQQNVNQLMKEPLLVRLSKLEALLREEGEQLLHGEQKQKYLNRAETVHDATELLRRLASVLRHAEDACL